MRNLPHATLCCLLLTGTGLCQQLSWVSTFMSPAPLPRVNHALAYDSARRQLVVFGGLYHVRFHFSDTWLLDDKGWTLAKPKTSPDPRREHAMAYDSARSKTVLFGGINDYDVFSETWEWDGADWTEIKTTPRPFARSSHCMAYDSARKCMVLFGGVARGSNMDDTWEFRNGLWYEAHPRTTPPRGLGEMAYDASRKLTMLLITNGAALETWTWNGVDWKKLSPVNTPYLSHPQLTYDSRRKRMVATSFRFTMEWDGSRWQQNKLASFSVATNQLAYDKYRRLTVSVGQNGPGGPDENVLTYGLTGTAIPFGKGCGASPGVKLSPKWNYHHPAIGTTFGLVVANLPSTSTMAIMSAGTSNTAMGSVKLPLDLTSFGMPGCFLYHSFEIVLPFSVSGGTGKFDVTIPRDFSLAGTRLYLQAAADKLTSNGLSVLIGTH